MAGEANIKKAKVKKGVLPVFPPPCTGMLRAACYTRGDRPGYLPLSGLFRSGRQTDGGGASQEGSLHP